MRAILFLVGFLLSTQAHAHYLEAYRQIQEGAPSVDTVDAFLAKRVDGTPFGVSAFLLLTEGWGEAYVGPTLAPTEWLELSLSVGGEQTLEGNLGWRYASSIWIGSEPWSVLGIVEANNATFEGDDAGVWYDLTATYQLQDWLSLGLRDRRFVGAGPHLVLTHLNAKVSLWTTWTPIDPEGLAPTDPLRFLFGTQLSF